MDGNGKNNSKVSTLRQRFESYDKVEQRRPSLVAVFPTILNQLSTSNKSFEDTEVSKEESRSRGDIKLFSHGIIDESTSSRIPRSGSEKDLLMSISVASSTADAASRRNGIYVSHDIKPSRTHHEVQSKRRGLVILDDDDVVTRVHRRGEVPEDDEFMDDEDDVEDELEDVDDVEHDDDPAEETSIPMAFDRHYEIHGDGSSIASNSTTSSHRSFHGFASSARSHSTILNNQSKNRNVVTMVETSGKNEKVSVLVNNNNGTGGPRDSGSKANTPTSSSSCSSGSGGCGKVKRRNAFRHKDVSSFPTSAAAGDSSSAILAAVAKTKVAVERVKSLDSATSNVNSSGCITSSTVANSSSVKNISSDNSTMLDSAKKSVSARNFPFESSNLSSSKAKGKSNNNVGMGLVNESSSKNDNNAIDNNASKSSPAQRAASLCVRATNSNTANNANNNSFSSNKSSVRSSSQVYEPCANSAFARNNVGGNATNYPQHLQILQHHQLPNCNNGRSNNKVISNTTDNLSSNNSSSGSSSQRVVNVVTPYQVTDIYNQLKINEALPANPKSAQRNLKQMLDEVEYAIPMIQNYPQPRYQQQSSPNQHSSQLIPSPPKEIPPKVPPAPLNYPPSSIPKEQFGLPSPNSSYTFLPHRNPQQTTPTTTTCHQASAFSPIKNSNSKTKDTKMKQASCNDEKKGASFRPPEKPPRTFLYNQGQRQLHPIHQGKQQRSSNVKQSPDRSNDVYGSTTTSSYKNRLTTVASKSSAPSIYKNTSSDNLSSISASVSGGSSSSSTSGALGLPSLSLTKRQHSSSSSSSTLTSGTAATIINNYRHQMLPTNPDSNVSSNHSFQQSPVQLSKQKRIDGSGNSNNNSTKNQIINPNQESPRTPKSSSNGHKTSSKHLHSHHHHHHVHPPLVRSKTESQLVVKSKSNSNRYLNRPSDVTLTYGMEMMTLEPEHQHQGIVADATNANVNSSSPSGFHSVYSSNCPPAHHQSQTNLLTGYKIYEQQQYRSINNLLRLSKNINSGGVQHYNKYPSNPGLHYASRELSWHDNNSPVPVNSSGNNNLYSGGDIQNSTRHSSLMYATNIDISSEDQQRLDERQQGGASFTRNNNSNNVDLLQQQQNALYSTKASDNLSVQQQLRSSSQFSHNHFLHNHYHHHPLYQYRLSERSKSEWALNASTYSGGGSTSSINSNNCGVAARGGSENRGNNNSPSFGPSTNQQNNQCPPHVMSRRATVAIAGSSSVGSPQTALTGGLGGSAGHPSLDSTSSIANSSSTQHSNNGMKGHRHHHGAPHSIQHLVNQLFSASAIKDATSSTDSGIQLGSESLSSCDTPIGDSTTDTGDSDCENEADASNIARKVVEARKGYVRRVSSVRVQELGESLHRLIQSSKVPLNVDPLFECLLIVGLDRDPTNGIYHPYIREKFPRDAKLAEGVEQFCFPDSFEWPCHEGSTAQFYTLAITDQRGARKYGCCFRILPEGANFCIPITYCIISSHRAIGFYREVLREITACHGHSEYQRRHFLQELHKKSFPPPGSSISVEPSIEETYGHNDRVTYGNITASSPKPVTIRRRADHRLDEGDLVTLVSTVDLSIVIKLFGSLLLERKVVLLSRALSTLSLCVEALESLLYPFSWQHTFVPILPLDMTDVIDAPAPFVIGVLRSSQNAWDKTLDDGIVVDLDVENGKVISCVGDEGTILPKRINRKLRNALSQLVIDLADQKDSTKNVLISECFIRMFVETIGHYSNHIVTKPDGTKAFEREVFVKSADSKATQNFLEWFSETSMFNEFMEMKLKNSHQHGLFEQRVMEQIDTGPVIHGSSASGGTPLKKDIWVKMKGPFGTWLKETFK